jgi:HEAT repeat protein
MESAARMKNPKFLIGLTLAGLAAALVIVALVRPAPSEPVYQGRSLRAWLVEFDPGEGTTNYTAAQEAIHAMGTNSLPHLIRYLRSQDPPFYYQWVRLKAKLRVLHDPVEYAVFWHRRAATACGEFGQDAEPAFPALVKAMNDPHAASYVGNALSRMLPKSAPVLTNILATGNTSARCRAADALMTAFSHPEIEEMSRTALLNALRDPDSGLRMTAASALQFWNKRLDLVVPALTRALSDPDPSVRGNAATSLGNFGRAAIPAVPELLKLLQDTNDYPRRRAMEMLLKIDPEAAAKAIGK